MGDGGWHQEVEQRRREGAKKQKRSFPSSLGRSTLRSALRVFASSLFMIFSSPSPLLLFPPGDELVRDSEVIKHAGDDGVHDLFNGLGAVVEGRVGGENHRARLDQ